MDLIDVLEARWLRLGKKERELEDRVREGFKKSRGLGEAGNHQLAEEVYENTRRDEAELKIVKEAIKQIEPKYLGMMRRRNRVR